MDYKMRVDLNVRGSLFRKNEEVSIEILYAISLFCIYTLKIKHFNKDFNRFEVIILKLPFMGFQKCFKKA